VSDRAEQPPRDGDSDERAPLTGTWRRFYALVLAALAVEIALLGWLSWAYR
jgi:hypothetical protein